MPNGKNGVPIEIDGQIFEVDGDSIMGGGIVPGFGSGGDVLESIGGGSGLAEVPLSQNAGGGTAVFYNGKFVGMK